MNEQRSRVYEVRDNELNVSHLVTAISSAAAIRAIAEIRYSASVPSTKRVMELMTGGHPLVTAPTLNIVGDAA